MYVSCIVHLYQVLCAVFGCLWLFPTVAWHMNLPENLDQTSEIGNGQTVGHVSTDTKLLRYKRAMMPGKRPHCFTRANKTNAVWGLIASPAQVDGVNTFYFGDVRDKVDECEKFCAQQRNCAVYTMYWTDSPKVAWRGQCYGRSTFKNIQIEQPGTVSGRKVSCITGFKVSLFNNKNNHTNMGTVIVAAANSSNWGTVCDHGWNDMAATVVCRQLGYKMGVGHSSAKFGRGSGQIFLDEVKCQGTEISLHQCDHQRWGDHNCNHESDAGVECFNTTARVGGPGRPGYAYVLINTTTYHVCGDTVTDTEAKVLCRQAGLVDGQTFNGGIPGTQSTAFYRRNTIGKVQCTGEEMSVLDCNYTTALVPCKLNDYAKILCFNRTLMEDEKKLKVLIVGSGNNTNYGSVQVRYKTVWMSVCQYAADRNFVNVVCRSLGFKGGEKLFPQNQDKLANWSPNIRCNGTEKSVDDCFFNRTQLANVTTACGTRADLRVLCYREGFELKLRGGDSNPRPSWGRVDIKYDGVWGTVCDSSWSLNDARVLCRQLGFKDGTAYTNAKYGRGSGPFWLSGLNCVGTESNILQCSSRGWGVAYPCSSHSDDASLKCYENVRLVGGNNMYGRVEVRRNRVWGGVCGTGWDDKDANVTCRELGFATGTAAGKIIGNSYWYSLNMNRVACKGTELELLQCPHSTYSYCSSKSSNYASVICSNETNFTTDHNYKVTLEGAASSTARAYTGRVRLIGGNTMGRICPDAWDDKDANVTCKQLNFRGGVAYRYSSQGVGPYLITMVRCNGSETNLNECNFLQGTSCRLSGAAGVLCYRTELSIRLVSGGLDYGVIEITRDGQRGYVCDSYWSSTDAKVVCNSLGYAGGTTYYKYKYSTTPFMVNPSCRGGETSLWQCSNSGWRASCSYYSRRRQRGVKCHKYARLQLGNTGSSSTNLKQTVYGRVEVYVQNTWGLVCADGFHYKDAIVFCRQIGYKYAKILGPGRYGYSSSSKWINPVRCNGSESSIQQCPYSFDICSRGRFRAKEYNYATALCSQSPLAEAYTVSLESSNTVGYFGHVRIFQYGIYGKICYKRWNDAAANVTCKHLGYKGGVALLYSGGASGYAWITEVNCTGQETSLRQCIMSYHYIDGCGSGSRIASVLCHRMSGIKYRLAGGSKRSGRVEIQHEGIWGTICDYSWSENDARVICRQLGYGYGVHNKPSSFGDGRGHQYLSNLLCGSSEKSILQCPNSGWKLSRSSSCRDAAVICQEDVRIGDGSTAVGSVQSFRAGRWGYICDDGWDDNDAGVLCRQHDYMHGKALCCSAMTGSRYVDYIATNIGCTGVERKLQECQNVSHATYSRFVRINCPRRQYASVLCFNRKPSGEDYKVEKVNTFSRGSVVGPVLVKYAGVWGRICPGNISNTTAEVICRGRGFTRGILMRTPLRGSGPFWMNNITCAGNETSLLHCKHAGWGNLQGCDNSITDVQVACSNLPRSFSVRLANGSLSGPSMYGRVEVLIDGQWGTISESSWYDDEASAVCRMLGYNGGRAFRRAYFGRGSGPIHIRDVQCNGKEADLWQCGIQFTTAGFYSHSYDVGVQCYKNVQLVGSSLFGEGAVKYFYDNTWLPLCDTNFDQNAARLVCREFGFPYGVPVCCNAYGRYYGRFVQLTEKLTQSNQSISKSKKQVSSCITSAGVMCVKQVPDNSPFSIKLAGGGTYWGRLEVKIKGLQGRVCPVQWSDTAASVACRDLKFKGGVAYQLTQKTDKPFVMGRVNCSGSSSSLENCSYIPLGGNTGCHSSSYDAGVLCYRTSGIRYRLTGGSKHKGRADVSYDGQWGTICRWGWGSSDADVFCRQIGFAGGSTHYVSYSDRAPLYWPIYLNNMNCYGKEDNFLMCRNPGWKSGISSSCQGHRRDAGVYCYGPVRLHNGRTATNGRVEIRRNNKWTVVCDRHWDKRDAGVICRQLGFSAGLALCCGAYGHQYSYSSSTDNVRCKGNEHSLLNCSYSVPSNSQCGRTKYASVLCYRGSKPTSFSLSLKGGYSYTGLVSIKFSSLNGRICADGWDDNDAKVACRALGYQTGQAYYHYGSSYIYGVHRNLYWTSNVNCSGSETYLQQCPMVPIGEVTHCSSKHSAGVLCSNSEGIFYRLAGKSPNAGRVEVKINGEWGTICFYSQLDDRDATVMCREMGYAAGVTTTADISQYGRGTGPVWQIDAYCVGNETSLHNCALNGWKKTTSYMCRDHRKDLGIYCYETVRIKSFGSRNRSHGPVEIFQDGGWHSVCDQNFTDTAARLICRELDFQDGWAVCCSAYTSETDMSQERYNYSISCTGSENSTKFCNIRSDCQSKMYASVICKRQGNTGTGYAVNKTNLGLATYQVAVNFAGVPGTICPRRWGDEEARVVCGENNSSDTGIAVFLAKGMERFPVLMSDFNCTGSEKSLFDCPYHNHTNSMICAGYNYMTGVLCYKRYSPGVQFRIGGNYSRTEGRAEINIGGKWGPICSAQWGRNEAAVFCRQVGFPDGFFSTRSFPGYKMTWLSDLQCAGRENTLLKCPHSGWEIGMVLPLCARNRRIASVSCFKEVSLSHLPDTNIGTLVVYKKNEQGLVCEDGWDDGNTRVVCTQLGFVDGKMLRKATYVAEKTSKEYLILNSIKCLSNETSILKCVDWVSKPCSSGYVVTLMCSNETITDTGFGLEIYQGFGDYHGVLKVEMGGLSGIICNDTWTHKDASVACRQLKFTGGVALPKAMSHRLINQIIQPTLMHNVQCKGAEKSIDQCKYTKWGKKDKCQGRIGQAAYVVCYKSELKFRISGGTANQGRVEIIHDGIVGTICDGGWNRRAAKVFCKQMKFNDGYALRATNSVPGNGKIWLAWVICDGTEDSILSCANGGWDYVPHSPSESRECATPAGVHCLKEHMAISDVQLVDGDEEGVFSGRLEVFVSGASAWGTVCGEDFNEKAAQVVCRMKGYKKGKRIPLGSIPEGRGRIWLSKIRCAGTETNIATCKLDELEYNTCDHSNDVAIECSGKISVASTTKGPSSTQSEPFSPTTTGKPTITTARSPSPLTTAPRTNKPSSPRTSSSTNPTSSPNIYTATSSGLIPTTNKGGVKAPQQDERIPLLGLVIPLIVIIIIAFIVIIIVSYKWRRALKSPHRYPVIEPPAVNLHLMAAETNLGEEYPPNPAYDGSMRFSNKLYDMNVDNDIDLGDQEKKRLM